MAKNDELASDIRRRLSDAGVVSFNFVSSPGSGKTLLLEKTLAALGHEIRMSVITGDVQTQNDADRLARHTDKLVHAVITAGACHLDSKQIEESLTHVNLLETDILFIENVGNLVCPASWDLGENAKIAILSVTEGEDKPLKYPKMFQNAKYAILNKIDLLPYVPFDVDLATKYAQQVNPELQFFYVSAQTGAGMETWYDFLRQQVK